MIQKNSGNDKSIFKNKYFIPVISIAIYIFIAVIISVAVKFATVTEDTNVSIAANSGEEAFFNGKYDSAVSEYTSLQEKSDWPLWNMKISEIYSIQGSYKKSNELIQKVYDSRNKIIDTENTKSEELLEKDMELANSIVFNLFVNGEYEKSLEYGELFLQHYPENENLLKTMFPVYIANTHNDKAQSIIDIFTEKEDINALITAAKMNMLTEKYEKGLKLLKKAYDLDPDNIEIFDSIEYAARYNKNNILNSLRKLMNNDDVVYKLFLAKVYSMDVSDTEKCEKIIGELDDDFSGNINYLFIKMKMYINKDEKKEADNVLDKIIESNENTFIGEYAESLKLYYEKKYDESLKHAKKSVLLNRDYVKTYSTLIPSILLEQKKTTEEEPYLRTALVKEPFNFDILVTTAEYYKDIIKDSSKALHYYTLASKVNPSNAEVLYKMALIQHNNQRDDEAIDLLKKSIKVNNNEAKYHRALGAIYLEKEKNEEGIAQIRKAYSIDENDIGTLNNAAYYYIYVEHDINRAMSNIKAAYEGVKGTTPDSEKEIITDNYNRIKVIYDSSKSNSSSKNHGVVSELKLIY
ncbi:MAG: tetratricopeptide repeat protein [Clostridium sp.]